jgi:hypothetical protein
LNLLHDPIKLDSQHPDTHTGNFVPMVKIIS